jgi:type I restriction enzyme R subunit
VRDDYGKLFFNILDYTGSATRLFADPDFDGDFAQVTEEEMDASGATIEEQESVEQEESPPVPGLTFDDDSTPPRKYYVDAAVVEIAAHLVYELDADGRRLHVKKFTEYTGECVRSMYPSAAELEDRRSSQGCHKISSALTSYASRVLESWKLMWMNQVFQAAFFSAR